MRAEGFELRLEQQQLRAPGDGRDVLGAGLAEQDAGATGARTAFVARVYCCRGG